MENETGYDIERNPSTTTIIAQQESKSWVFYRPSKSIYEKNKQLQKLKGIQKQDLLPSIF